MKPNDIEKKKWVPTPEDLNYRFRYDALTGLLHVNNRTKWRTRIGKICGARNSDGYLRVSINNNLFPVHRVIWAMVYGAWPSEMIDHINGVRDDNRISNLREATRFQNPWNKGISKRNKSGVKGVSWAAQKQKWRASLMVDGKSHSVGYFKLLVDAEASIKAARETFHGEFARHI